MTLCLFSLPAEAQRDEALLQQNLIDQANIIQSIEKEILRNQTRLNALYKKLTEIEQNRTNHQSHIQKAGGVLIRLMRRPENIPTVSKLDLIRGEYIMTDVQHRAVELLKQLAKRNKTTARLLNESQTKQYILKTNLKKRQQARDVLEALLSQKEKKQKNKKIYQLRARQGKAIASNKKNVTALITSIIQQGKSHYSRRKNTGPFLYPPGAGTLRHRFGDKNSLGMYSFGLSYDMLPAARVIAPMNGQILFAGPFHHHQNMIIIAGTGGYHVSLSGLARLDVELGEVVMAGEPVGLMPKSKTPKLYLELRDHGRPIDPFGLFIKSQNKES